MKKAYSAPLIAYQALNVGTNNGGGCEYVHIGDNNAMTTSCPVKDKVNGMVVYAEAPCLELGAWGGYEPEGGICYGTPSASANVANS